MILTWLQIHLRNTFQEDWLRSLNLLGWFRRRSTFAPMFFTSIDNLWISFIRLWSTKRTLNNQWMKTCHQINGIWVKNLKKKCDEKLKENSNFCLPKLIQFDQISLPYNLPWFLQLLIVAVDKKSQTTRTSFQDILNKLINLH